MADTPTTQHSLIDDIQGLGSGVCLAALGLHLLTSLGLITGQTAGVAVILSYLTGYGFGPLFFAINLPFYLLAWRRLGPTFTIKSMICVTLLSVLSEILPRGMVMAYIDPALGVIIFGILTGTGLLMLFRHNGSLGGMGVVALLIQDTTGFRAGWVQLIFDALVFGAAFFIFESSIVLYSLLGAVVMNLVITINHRRDRYIAT